MSSAQAVVKAWLFTRHATSQRAPGAASPIVRGVSTDAPVRRPRALRQEQYAKRLEAVKAGQVAQLPMHQPIGPPIFDVQDILPMKETSTLPEHAQTPSPPTSAKDRDIVASRHRTTTPTQFDNIPLSRKGPASLSKKLMGTASIRHRHDESITMKTDHSLTKFAETPSFNEIKRKWARSFQPDDSCSYLQRPSFDRDVTHNHRPRDRLTFYRAVSITRLDLDSTLTDLMQAIAAAGPFGMVTSASIDEVRRAAEVVFNAEAAAQRFITHATTKGFRLGTAAPVVKLNTIKGFRDEPNDQIYSRVLRITGDPKVEGFDVDSLRRILSKRFRRPLDHPRWLASEPPRTSWFRDGNKIIQWSFFSNEFQTRPFQIALRQHFGGKLFVGYGVDPCGDFKETQNRRAKFHYLADQGRTDRPLNHFEEKPQTDSANASSSGGPFTIQTRPVFGGSST